MVSGATGRVGSGKAARLYPLPTKETRYPCPDSLSSSGQPIPGKPACCRHDGTHDGFRVKDQSFSCCVGLSARDGGSKERTRCTGNLTI